MSMEHVAIIKDRLNKLMDQLAPTGGKMWPEQSKLRLSLPIKDGKGQYIFNLKEGGDGLSTFALDRNDVFIPNYMGVLLELVNTTTGVKRTYSFAPVNDGTTPSVFPVAFKDNQILLCSPSGFSFSSVLSATKRRMPSMKKLTFPFSLP